MGRYTDFLENKIYDIFPEDDNYIEELMEAVKLFRSFDEALDTFLPSRGYQGDISDVDMKVHFISDKFKQSDIPVPRNIKRWFTVHQAVSRRTAFQICFAFNLSVEETEDFFRRIYLQRSFDCHNSKELICWYSMGHHLSYSEFTALTEQIDRVEMTDIKPSEDVIYTSSIMEDTARIKDGDVLVSYINAHIGQFGYNNVTASKYIRQVWNEITSGGGLAEKERHRLYKNAAAEIKIQPKTKTREDSVWGIYLQILGLSAECIHMTSTDRSIKPMLKESGLLHPLAEASFPDRDGINKILGGSHVSYERIRKILILLLFYKYWVRLALKRGNYQALYDDSSRCMTQINNYLMDVGYPQLYAGNPFDWMMMYTMGDTFPLITFREYMIELFSGMEDLQCSRP